MRFQRRSAVVSNLRNYLRRFRVLQPLQPAIQFLSKQWKIDWFREARSAARLQDPFLLRHQGVCRHGNHGDFAQLWFLAHPCEEVEAVFGTEINIE